MSGTPQGGLFTPDKKPFEETPTRAMTHTSTVEVLQFDDPKDFESSTDSESEEENDNTPSPPQPSRTPPPQAPSAPNDAPSASVPEPVPMPSLIDSAKDQQGRPAGSDPEEPWRHGNGGRAYNH